jgi:predicted nucleic acid-binding Zn ribbon protein
MESGTHNPRRDDPHRLGDVLSHLFTLRGYTRTQTGRQLAEIWASLAGETIAARTRVQGIKATVLQIGVHNSAMLQELEGFHKWSLLEQFQQQHADLGITDIRFRLSSRPEVGTSNSSS